MRCEAILDEVKLITPTVKHFVFSVPEGFTFKAGQFVYARCNLESGPVKKPYSIASPPELKGKVELCIKKVEGGLGSTFLHKIEQGTELQLTGPFGTFTVQNEDRPITFIATGTGIAPFRSIIQSLLSNDFKHEIVLIAGVRHEEEVLYEEEWIKLQEEHENFKYFSTCSRPSENYSGQCGRVQTIIEKEITSDFKGDIYICGLSPMINDVEQLLTDKGISKEQIHFEKYD